MAVLSERFQDTLKGLIVEGNHAYPLPPIDPPVLRCDSAGCCPRLTSLIRRRWGQAELIGDPLPRQPFPAVPEGLKREFVCFPGA